MLFRRCAPYTFILLIFGTFSLADDKLDIYLKQGKELGRSIKRSELSPEDIEAITPKDLKGKTFDGESARKQLNSVSYQNIEDFPQKNLDPAIIAILENAEYAMKPVSSPTEEVYEVIEKCIVENTLEPISLNHVLNVTVVHKDEVVQTTKVCKGHSSKEKTDSPEFDKRSQKKRFEADPTIQSYSVKIKSKGFGHRDVIVCHWTHRNNTSSCDSFREEKIKNSPEAWEEIDFWNLQSPELLDNIDCTLVSTVNGPAETRIIEGRVISRPFWTKTQHLQCIRKNTKNCDFLKKMSCVSTSETCIHKTFNQCLVSEMIFKCQTRKEYAMTSFKGIYGTDAKLWDTTYQPNQELADVATKLAVFDEMKKELLNTQSLDVRIVQLFKGNEEQCSKSIAEDLMYDCCFDMDGLATKMKLSKCTSDEIALAESRRKGLTHYIGMKKEKFLGLWVSRKEHVFCVFPSKLSRVFQEAARDQLRIDWGTADHPDCRGLSQEEIKKINFSKLDLSEAFELSKIPDQQEKLQKIEERLKQRIEAM